MRSTRTCSTSLSRSIVVALVSLFGFLAFTGSVALAAKPAPAKRSHSVVPTVSVDKTSPGKVVVYVRAPKNATTRLEVDPCPYAETSQAVCAKASYPTADKVVGRRAQVLTYLVSVSPNQRVEGTLTVLVPTTSKSGAQTKLEYQSTLQVSQRGASAKPVILYAELGLVKQAKTMTYVPQASRPAVSTAPPQASVSIGSLSNASTSLTLSSSPALSANYSFVGLPVSTSNGEWVSSAPITFSYQWYDEDSYGTVTRIAGATQNTYLPKASDQGHYLVALVTATNGSNTISVWSNYAGSPVEFFGTSISWEGSLAVGNTVFAGDPYNYYGSSLVITNVGYQWQRCDSIGNCTNIAGATTSSYVLQTSDVGDTVLAIISGTVNGTVIAGPSGMTNEPTTALPLVPENTSIPIISDNGVPIVDSQTVPEVGDVLTTTDGTWSSQSPITYSYQWYGCLDIGQCGPIDGATSSSYTVPAWEQGYAFFAVVKATNQYENNSVDSNETAHNAG